MNIVCRIVFSVLAWTLLSAAEVQAAGNNSEAAQRTAAQSNAPKYQSKGMPRPASADKDYANEKLTGFIDLPDLPRYSGAGAVFLSGLKYPHTNFGQALSFSFGVMEQAPQVNDWYKAALQQYQWSLNTVKPNPSARPDEYSIDAAKGKYNVHVSIQGVTRKPYRTLVEIRYKFAK